MALEREKRKLRQANETLRRASACFATAERPRIEDHREDACAMRHTGKNSALRKRRMEGIKKNLDWLLPIEICPEMIQV